MEVSPSKIPSKRQAIQILQNILGFLEFTIRELIQALETTLVDGRAGGYRFLLEEDGNDVAGS